MSDSLKDRILGLQGVIAASHTVRVKKFSQPHQRREAHVGPVVILHGSTRLLVDHPAREYATRSIRQRDNNILGIGLGYPPQDMHLTSTERMIAIP
jgi:hypothetical protein